MISLTSRFKKSAALSLALALSGTAFAQIGSGWSTYDPDQFLHAQQHNTGNDDRYDSTATMPRSQWNVTYFAYDLNGPTSDGQPPAWYQRDAALEKEVFTLHGNTTETGNRCEIRIADNYGPGQVRQFEGYLTVYSPTDAQTMMQIWGSEAGASQLMFRTYDNGTQGSYAVNYSGGTPKYLTNRYGTETKINIIHIQNSAAGQNNGRIYVYADGQKLIDFVDDEDPTNTSPTKTNYMKYGIYQTVTAGHENPVVMWKNVKFYQGGSAPGTTAQTINNMPAVLTKSVGDVDFSPGATASPSGLGVTYRSSDLSVATIVANKVHILKEGTVTIWANQNGNGTYAPAASKTMMLTIQKKSALFESSYQSNLTTSTPRVSCGAFATAQNKLTVSFWARADALGTMVPVDKLPATGTDGGWNVKFRSDGAIWFRAGSEATHTDVRLGAGTYAPNTWIHVTCTYDGSTMTAYINGTVPTGGTNSGASGINIVGTTDLSIGRPSVAATGEIYSGDLRDIRYYDRVLSTQEIALLAVFPQWLYNGPKTFAGTATDFVSGGTSSGSGTSLSVSFFMTAAQLASMQPIDKLPADATAPNGAAGGWSIKLRSDNSLWFRIGNETSNTTTVAPNAYLVGTKIHVVCTFNAGTAKTYLDGVESTAATLTGITKSVSNTNVDLRLAVPQRAATSNIYQGDLERVRIYHQALTAAQIGLLADGL